MEDKIIYVKDLKEHFNFKQVAGSESSLNRWIIVADINRPGLELSGFTGTNELKRVCIIGNKEMEYMQNFDYNTQRQKFEVITDSYTPCIIFASMYDLPQSLVDLANDKNFPVFVTELPSYRVIVEVVSYMAEGLAQTDTLHGEMLNIYGKGVLLIGSSGIGKSELALELIKRGHLFVADDRVEVQSLPNSIQCSAPDILKKRLEIRGLGIVDVSQMFGGSCYVDKSKLDIVIKLEKTETMHQFSRIDQDTSTYTIIDKVFPLITVPVTPGRSIAVLVEAVVSDFILREHGYNATEEFKQDVLKLIEEGKKNAK